jgi:hypothetical protein
LHLEATGCDWARRHRGVEAGITEGLAWYRNQWFLYYGCAVAIAHTTTAGAVPVAILDVQNDEVILETPINNLNAGDTVGLSSPDSTGRPASSAAGKDHMRTI